ncbi:tyrosine/DOPA decarboxylase 2-like protein [Cinnamomum micranthum f. kanehirae]|uniref:Tyrosine/DOPA decarboxylase 2-like protein n=1 Tax=Cinnamomum micranthum f. kanehirae TaxID=337451 RepID=A0A3S3P079_9MAGN|nr:tyrosine/DOPA decarboxylase 2-like protein [Cinnamomum micranthum f. kanehirae]
MYEKEDISFSSSMTTTITSYFGFLLAASTITPALLISLIPITLAGLFVTAYLQYRRGDQLDL